MGKKTKGISRKAIDELIAEYEMLLEETEQIDDRVYQYMRLGELYAAKHNYAEVNKIIDKLLQSKEHLAEQSRNPSDISTINKKIKYLEELIPKDAREKMISPATEYQQTRLRNMASTRGRV